MRRSSSPPSVAGELLWLFIWLVLFVAITTAMIKYVVPHHFNDRVAVMISAIVSGLAMIGLRAYFTRRA